MSQAQRKSDPSAPRPASPTVAILTAYAGTAAGAAVMFVLGGYLSTLGAGIWQRIFGPEPSGLPFVGDVGAGYIGGWLLAAALGYAAGRAVQRGVSAIVYRRPAAEQDDAPPRLPR